MNDAYDVVAERHDVFGKDTNDEVVLPLKREIFPAIAPIRFDVEKMEVAIDLHGDPQRRTREIDLERTRTEAHVELVVENEEAFARRVSLECFEERSLGGAASLVNDGSSDGSGSRSRAIVCFGKRARANEGTSAVAAWQIQPGVPLLGGRGDGDGELRRCLRHEHRDAKSGINVGMLDEDGRSAMPENALGSGEQPRGWRRFTAHEVRDQEMAVGVACVEESVTTYGRPELDLELASFRHGGGPTQPQEPRKKRRAQFGRRAGDERGNDFVDREGIDENDPRVFDEPDAPRIGADESNWRRRSSDAAVGMDCERAYERFDPQHDRRRWHGAAAVSSPQASETTQQAKSWIRRNSVAMTRRCHGGSVSSNRQSTRPCGLAPKGVVGLFSTAAR